ncbi:hypothetical protein CO026_02715 [Candidatus Kaiserbacteria bacterium CG_4_9_14_0_2_um_filter_41_32]|uniref:Thymidylate kinase-like domain-containing protein n=2 Tax=Patescibacteria group TaxID=1783273 RepID=A0A2M8FEH6_9BACT|nr:MAG: hypothetical protein COV58_03345 [Candidatus Roizmanbacteria bacterium CG11_big_fil_rev_8_21_14_0_20_36_8]PJC55992.1 MAG: hypothetical protein CO026_02715 [Candidatus Kaiserbacteria bacterium CG_4_9_14_0_2_um_filter_41_32]
MSNYPPPLYVECVGLPGSGKTTLVTELLAHVREPESVVTRQPFFSTKSLGKKILLAYSLSLRFGIPYLTAGWRCFGLSGIISRPFLRSYSEYIALHQVRMINPTTLVIYDQGPVTSAIWLSIQQKIPKERVHKFLQRVAISPALYVYLDISPALSYERCQGRAKNNDTIMTFTANRADEILNSFALYYEYHFSQIQNPSGMVLRLNAEESMGENVTRLITELSSRLPGVFK